MTAEEIAALVFEEQGFLVVSANYPREIGDSISDPFTNLKHGEKILVALRIIGPSTKTEFMEQSKRAQEMSGGPRMGDPAFPYYYRCEPQD